MKQLNLSENISYLIYRIVGHIKEPIGVDFVVDPTPLTEEERQRISEFITYYKRTGKKMPLPKPTSKKRSTQLTKREVA